MDFSQETYQLYSSWFAISNMVVYILGFPVLTRPINESIYLLDSEGEFRKLVREYLGREDEYVEYIKKMASEDKYEPPNYVSQLREYAYAQQGRLEEEIKRIPKTVDKAVAAVWAALQLSEYETDENDIYYALSYFRDEISEELKKKIFQKWHKDREENRGDADPLFPYETEIFWFIRTGREVVDTLARYQLKSFPSFGSFHEVFQTIETWAEEELTSHLSSFPSSIDGLGFYEVVHLLWIVSRDGSLVNSLQDAITIAVRRLSRLGQPTKASLQSPFFHVMSVALCAVVLLKLGEDKPAREQGILLSRWLISHQKLNGSWHEDGKAGIRDFLTTVLALEAIIRSDIEGVDLTIELGIDWLMSQQNELGIWETFKTFPYYTTIVLELLKLRQEYIPARYDHEQLAVQKVEDLLLNPIGNYRIILDSLYDMGRHMEKRPSIYENRDEESLRDLLLVNLQSRFKGSASAESFNKKGKTDILLSHDNKNAFIAECKFWDGRSKYFDTLNQLLSYLTWMDKYSAILLFVKNRDISSVETTIQTSTQEHPDFLAFVNKERDGWFNYRFFLNGDKGQEVNLAVLLFHFPD